MDRKTIALDELYEDVRNLMITDKFKRPEEPKEVKNDNEAEEKTSEENTGYGGGRPRSD